jgi:hypothetical protein
VVHVPLTFLSELHEFPSVASLQEKKLDESSRLDVLKSRLYPDMLPFSLCNKKRLAIRHRNRLIFPTKLSIPSYDFGKYVGLRTYQHHSYTKVHLNIGTPNAQFEVTLFLACSSDFNNIRSLLVYSFFSFSFICWYCVPSLSSVPRYL